MVGREQLSDEEKAVQEARLNQADAEPSYTRKCIGNLSTKTGDGFSFFVFHKPFHILDPERSGFSDKELRRLKVFSPGLDASFSGNIADIRCSRNSSTLVSGQDYHNQRVTYDRGSTDINPCTADAMFSIEVQAGIEDTWPTMALFLNEYGPVAIQTDGYGREGRLAGKLAQGLNRASYSHQNPREGLSFIFTKLMEDYCSIEPGATPEMIRRNLLTSFSVPQEVRGLMAGVYERAPQGEANFYQGLAAK